MSVLKTYNHQQGVTCICIGQIKDTGVPQGGEPLMHAADTVFLLETMYIASKEIGAEWGANAKDYIPVLVAVKSVTTPTFPHKLRVDRDGTTGALMVSSKQPAQYAVK